MATANEATVLDHAPTTDQAVLTDLFDQVFAEQQEGDTSISRETVGVTVSLAVEQPRERAGMHGWITYIDRGAPNKVYTPAIEFTHIQGEFVGGFAGPSLATAPEQAAGKTGTFHAAGFGPAGLLQMWIEGKPVFAVRLPIAGAGRGYWRVDGEVSFSPLQ